MFTFDTAADDLTIQSWRNITLLFSESNICIMAFEMHSSRAFTGKRRKERHPKMEAG